jgi:cytochrome c-type biogenesis protein CcmH/NrfG
MSSPAESWSIQVQGGTNRRQMTETASSWNAWQVYISAAICLALGVTLGYLFRGSGSSFIAASAPTVQALSSDSKPHMPTLEQMKQIADKQAAPLLVKLQTDPNNGGVLAQIGRIYESTHQFKAAASYYTKSLELQPGNVEIRDALASCLYYSGNPDGAVQQLEQALKTDPKNANSLFNLGLIRWLAKKDGPGAITVWKQLLRTNPKLDDQRKAAVQKLIADASQNGQVQRSTSKY